MKLHPMDTKPRALANRIYDGLVDENKRLRSALAWMDNHDPELVIEACARFGLDSDTYDKKERD
jgi:hypothetical protein